MFHLFHLRDDAVGEAAATAGLQSAEGDPLGCDDAPFPLFRRGELRQVERVLWRDDDPRQVRVFDFRYERNYGSQREVSPIYTCATAVVNAAWPPLLITPSPLRDEREALEVGGSVTQLESDDFNQAFLVHTPDARFASAFLDARMQQFLLDKGRALTFELHGSWLLAFTEHIPAELLPDLFPFIDDLVAHVPDVVSSLYPPALPGGLATPMPPLTAASSGAAATATDPATGAPLTSGQLAAQRFDDEVLAGTSGFGVLRRRGFGMFGASMVGAEATDLAMRSEILADPAWSTIDRSPLESLDDAAPAQPAEPEVDLDGNPVAPQHEDPWGAGRPEHAGPDTQPTD